MKVPSQNIDLTITKDDIVESLLNDEVYYETKNSEISKFYSGKCVFITGGTGFLGKLLIEKLLRACPDISCIFMLVRAKKGKDPHTRTEEIFNEALYHKLSKLQPKFRHKIVLINGDVSLPGMGMTIEDRQLVREKATIFIHSAATVKFNEKLSNAVDINVKGTKELITLAKECQHVDSVVHISTAYCPRPQSVIEEEIYSVPFDAEKITQICNATPPALIDQVTPELLGKWPNTYVFTKAIAEDFIKKNSAQLPVCIVRPAVVIGTYKEPIKAWIDNIYGATGIVVGAGVGVIRVVNINANANSEVVPGDLVINAVIAASYKTALEKTDQIPVYNYVASQNPITWKDFMALNAHYGVQTPSSRALWCYELTLIHNYYLFQMYSILVHFIPALLMDTCLFLIGKKPQLLTVYKKINNFNITINYFAGQNWTFVNKNVQNLYEKLSDEDKKLFFFDMSKVDWKQYFMVYCSGLRTYLLKEDVLTIDSARSRNRWFICGNYIIKFLFYGTLLRLLYGLIFHISTYF